MESLYQFVFTANACGVAVLTLLVYDWCISLGGEATLFWRAPRTSASILYLFNRYCIMLEWVLAMITIQPVSDLSCRGLYFTELVLSYFAMIGPALFSSLRVYALTGQHKLLAGITLTLALVPLFVNVSTAYQSYPANLDPPYNCSLDSSTPPKLATILTFLSRSGQTLADLLVVAVTWRETYKSSRIAAQTIHGPTFNQVMLHNGCIYFVVLATLNILHMVLTALSIRIPSGSESFVIDFIDPIASILVCHFLISLQEAKRTSQPAGTSPSFVHPDLPTGSGIDVAAPNSMMSMSMPSFVASLAGPLAVHSAETRQSALVDVESHFDEDGEGRGSGLSTADSGQLEGASSQGTEVDSGCTGLTRGKGNISNSAEGEASSSSTYGERSVSAA